MQDRDSGGARQRNIAVFAHLGWNFAASAPKWTFRGAMRTAQGGHSRALGNKIAPRP